MRRYIPYICCAILFCGCIYGISLRVRAEQVGSSPESGTTSHIKAINDSITALSYGSTAAGTWGDWGAMWNRLRSAGEKPFNDAVAKGMLAGSGTSGTSDCVTTADTNCYTQALGGVDDYNRGAAIPTDTYQQTWITCNSSAYTPANPGGNYCNTGRSVLNNLVSQDPNTSLVWSPRISPGSNWFVANNCKYPNGLAGDDGACGTDKEAACFCVKHTGVGEDTKTGCEVYDDGNWRLPTQKELMQSYIDGSWGNLATAAGAKYWSATTISNTTRNAWPTNQSTGYTYYGTKTTATYSVRCVR